LVHDDIRVEPIRQRNRGGASDADIAERRCHVRYVPKSRHMRRSEKAAYSITSSAMGAASWLCRGRNSQGCGPGAIPHSPPGSAGTIVRVFTDNALGGPVSFGIGFSTPRRYRLRIVVS
jgi:hypothetical protein